MPPTTQPAVWDRDAEDAQHALNLTPVRAEDLAANAAAMATNQLIDGGARPVEAFAGRAEVQPLPGGTTVVEAPAVPAHTQAAERSDVPAYSIEEGRDVAAAIGPAVNRLREAHLRQQDVELAA